jgi:hypothetical protein
MTPFETELNSGTTISVNGNPMPTAIYNLIISKRDISLWTKIGMKPHRGWNVSAAKKYFGIKGNGQNLMDEFTKIYDKYYPKN